MDIKFQRQSLSINTKRIIWEYNNLIMNINQTKMILKPNTKIIPKDLVSKAVAIKDNPNLKSIIKEYFLNSYSCYQKLFELLADDKAYYIRSEPLRHPLIFYYGHTATLYINKLFDYGVLKQRINERLQKMLAIGVDEMDWDDLNESHYSWPTVEEVRNYRQKAKETILHFIDTSSTNKIDNWLSDMWVLLLGIEHERIHLETSAVIIRRVPLDFIKQVEEFPECQYQQTDLNKIPKNKLVDVPSWKSVWERKKDSAQTYGWDNEFGVKQFNVEAFKATQMLVSNGEFLQFVLDGGYQTTEWWTDQGKGWINSMKPKMPLFWKKEDSKYQLRTLYQLIDMPWDWPAEVNNLEARAFCKWKSHKLGTYLRLPTEDQYYSIRSVLKKDLTNWEYQQVGNINLQYWMSPNPVNLFKTGDFYDVVGNVWQHTITPTYPFQGFEIHPSFDDFSTPTFDERHELIKGGSFISTGNEAIYHSRYAFRRHFNQFAGFRYIQTDREMEIDLHCQEIISDKNVEMNLHHHYQNNKSYIIQLSNQIISKIGDQAKSAKILTVGCSVGRIPMELSKYCQQSIGIDYTTRYFQMLTRLRQKKFLKFKNIDISLDSLEINADEVELYQMNPQNPDQKKVNECDWIIIDGFSVKKNKLAVILHKIIKLAKRNANIAILSVSGINELNKEQGKDIISSAVDGVVAAGEEVILKASYEDQSYLPEWNNQLQFKLNFYEISDP